MEDYLIEIQNGKHFVITTDMMMRLSQVSKEYVKGYVDALTVAFPHKFIFCNVVPNTKQYVMP